MLPNVKLFRLLTAWQGHSFQAVVEVTAKCQALKTAWQGHSVQALVEVTAKCQVFKAFWDTVVQILCGLLLLLSA